MKIKILTLFAPFFLIYPTSTIIKNNVENSLTYSSLDKSNLVNSDVIADINNFVAKDKFIDFKGNLICKHQKEQIKRNKVDLGDFGGNWRDVDEPTIALSLDKQPKYKWLDNKLYIDSKIKSSWSNTNYPPEYIKFSDNNAYFYNFDIPSINVDPLGRENLNLPINPSNSASKLFSFYKSTSINSQNIFNLLNSQYRKDSLRINTISSRPGWDASSESWTENSEEYISGYSGNYVLFGGRVEIRHRKFPKELDWNAINSINNMKFEAFNFKNIDILQSLFKVDFSKINFTDIQGKIWNASSIRNATRRLDVFKFSEAFMLLKTFSYVAETMDRIYNEVFLPSIQNNPPKLKSEIKDFFHHNGTLIEPCSKYIWSTIAGTKNTIWDELNWENNDGYKKETVQLLIEKLNELNVSSYEDLVQTVETFFNDSEHSFYGFPFGKKGSNLCDLYIKDEDNILFEMIGLSYKKFSSNWGYKEWDSFYKMLLHFFRCNDIYAYFEVFNSSTNEWETVQTNINDKKQDKLIPIWYTNDKGYSNWNFNIVNDIGIDYKEQNEIRFRIKKNDSKNDKNSDLIIIKPNKYNNKSNNLSITDNTLNNNSDDWRVIGKFIPIEEEIGVHLKYRYSAMPFDQIVLSDEYLQKFVKFFTITSNYKIQQLVRLNNSEDNFGLVDTDAKEKYYVNDLIVTDEYDAREVIKQSINDNVGLYVRDQEDFVNPYGGFDFIGDIKSGIGIGDLNKYWGFNSDNYFFKEESWQNALSSFGIRVDKENKKYPIFASSWKNNTVYAIATIPWWITQDGSHGNFEAIWKQVKKNRIKIDKETNDYDRDFQTMVELEPRTRIRADGSWDNNGYFLIKCYVGSPSGVWLNNLYDTPNQTGYQISSKGWEDLLEQYIKPPLEDSDNPLVNTGIGYIANGYKLGNEYNYWIKGTKKIVENSFFDSKEYEIECLKLNTNKIIEDADLSYSNDPTSKFQKLIHSIKFFVLHSNLYDREEREEILSNLREKKSQIDMVSKAINWFVFNAPMKVRINNFNFNDLWSLKNDYLLNELCKYYNISVDSFFTKKQVLVLGEPTKEYVTTFNKTLYGSKFNQNNFLPNKKIFRNKDNTFSLVDKSYRGEGVPYVTLSIPNSILLKIVDQKKGVKMISLPNEWLQNDFNPYSTTSYALSSPYYTMLSLASIKENSDYSTGEYISNNKEEFNVVHHKNITNIVIVASAPIIFIVLLFSILIGCGFAKSKIKKSKKPVSMEIANG